MLKNMVEEALIVIRLGHFIEQEPQHHCGVLINPRGDCWVHAGDSRIYHFEGAADLSHQRHSYVQALVDRGELTEAEANIHPHSNILVGAWAKRSTHHHPHHPALAARRCFAGLQRWCVAYFLPPGWPRWSIPCRRARPRISDRQGTLARTRGVAITCRWSS